MVSAFTHRPSRRFGIDRASTATTRVPGITIRPAITPVTAPATGCRVPKCATGTVIATSARSIAITRPGAMAPALTGGGGDGRRFFSARSCYRIGLARPSFNCSLAIPGFPGAIEFARVPRSPIDACETGYGDCGGGAGLRLQPACGGRWVVRRRLLRGDGVRPPPRLCPYSLPAHLPRAHAWAAPH